MIRRALSTRRRKVAAGAVAALALTGTAVAAFLIFTGATGSGNGTFATATTQNALTLTGTDSPELVPDNEVTIPLSIVNADTGNAHTLSTLTATFSSSPSECASHLVMNLQISNSPVGVIFPAGGTDTTHAVNVRSDPTLPSSCAGGTWSVTFTGTTSP